MYNALVILQSIICILCFISIVMIMVQRNTGIAKYMLLICICCFLQNAGYLQEMCSDNLTEAMMSVSFEYIGTSFILLCMTTFVFRYCKLKFPKIFTYILLAIGVAVLISVWTYENNPLYYSSAEWVTDGLMPHLVLGKGPLYIIFSVILFLEFFTCIAVCLITAFKVSNLNMRRSYFMLTFACTFPVIAYGLEMTGLGKGYDFAPIGGAVGILSFVFTVAYRHAFDLVEAANESILADLDEAVVILDYRGCYQEANKKALELFPELLKTPVGEQVKSEVLADIIKKNEGRELAIDNKYYDASINNIMSNNMMIGHSIVLVDTTEAKKQIDNMRKLREAADSANQAKSTFLASVSHEIRTPINVVVGMSDVIMRDCQDKNMLGYAENIQDAAKSLLDLINDILDFSKIESGKTDLVLGDYEARRFFFDMINTYQRIGEEKGLAFTTKISNKIPAKLFGDETRIRQIMTNILGNAFKYTREGYVELKADFEWTGTFTGRLILDVTDTGLGIREEDKAKLFEVFVRLDERINRAVEGTGLGLNITKQLLEMMNGEIKVESEYGKGSTFTIIIPQEVHCQQTETIGDINDYKPVRTKRKQVSYTAPDAKVLIIDDSKTNLIVAKALLRDTHVKITTGSSGFACLDLIKEEHYDVIFLDHRMPEMDGVETLKKMLESEHKCKDVPVIMLTANAVSDAKDYYMGEGFTDFISKPISEATITEMLKKYIPKDKLIENV